MLEVSVASDCLNMFMVITQAADLIGLREKPACKQPRQERHYDPRQHTYNRNIDDNSQKQWVPCGKKITKESRQNGG